MRARARRPLAERLAAHLVSADSGCLEWTGYRNAKGYGRIALGGRGDGTDFTHRVAWSLAHPGEPLPPQVRHTCDNPPCCEPTHLLEGTAADNAADAILRGRTARGDRHYSRRRF